MEDESSSRPAARRAVLLLGAVIGLPFIAIVVVVASLNSGSGNQPGLAGGLNDLSTIAELKTVFSNDQGSGRVFLLFDPI